jgi:hypothetical protein
MENKQVGQRERVLIVAMVEPGKPDPLEILYKIKSTLEHIDGVADVDVQQVGNVPISAQTFEGDLAKLINARFLENGSNTPDFLLAEYLLGCLDNWNKSVMKRERWYGRHHLDVSKIGHGG